MIARIVPAALVSLLAVACSRAPTAAPPAAVLPSAITGRGAPVYVGRVFPLHGKSETPTYLYERRVDETDGTFVSTHVTRDAAGAVQLAEAATHSADYTLTAYTLYSNQFGQTGSIRVANDEVWFRLIDGATERTKVEHHETKPVVVGPTLVGYIVRHLDALERGETLNVRFAVLDRLETIGFNLQKAPAPTGEARVKMNASSFLVNLIVPITHFTFDKATRKLIRLEGRVPPKVRDRDAWTDFDARVEYEFVASSYR
jgi:hypothetical protein